MGIREREKVRLILQIFWLSCQVEIGQRDAAALRDLFGKSERRPLKIPDENVEFAMGRLNSSRPERL